MYSGYSYSCTGRPLERNGLPVRIQLRFPANIADSFPFHRCSKIIPKYQMLVFGKIDASLIIRETITLKKKKCRKSRPMKNASINTQLPMIFRRILSRERMVLTRIIWDSSQWNRQIWIRIWAFHIRSASSDKYWHEPKLRFSNAKSDSVARYVT